MTTAIQCTRLAAKALAVCATIVGCFMALVISMSFGGSEWQLKVYAAFVTVTPVAQVGLVLMAAARDECAPRSASLLYILAVLMLSPVMLLILLK